MSERVIRPASYGLLIANNTILLCRLSSQTASPGLWTLPGGGLEFGEHPEEALVREISEETGLNAIRWELLHIQSEVEEYRAKTFHVLRFYYRVPEFAGELQMEQGGSTDACKWFAIRELDTLPVVPMVRFAISL
jgi:mutator protein MutT